MAHNSPITVSHLQRDQSPPTPSFRCASLESTSNCLYIWLVSVLSTDVSLCNCLKRNNLTLRAQVPHAWTISGPGYIGIHILNVKLIFKGQYLPGSDDNTHANSRKRSAQSLHSSHRFLQYLRLRPCLRTFADVTQVRR